MSITKPIVLDTGVTAEHWEITYLAEDMLAGVIDMNVHGWLNAAARSAGCEPLAVRKLRFTVAELAGAGVSLDLTAMLEPLLVNVLS